MLCGFAALAAARMTIVNAFLNMDGKVIWSVEWWEKKRDTTYVTRSKVPYAIAK